ncbi:phage regulatory protein [Ligilactobacillus murinus]|uniref:Rha family transcriptional regulator n=1 Tax=Ligilactobacillus murinus TaxID=1622 RepID=UPI001071AF93|nr:Rha family transcriptional regulator [Ligilactobacillus murinus]MBF0757377.1 Rha family transcriptional regulator [Ligilactobacillus murinus]MBF0832835.1 Rha family transcriptional regulator [Ligilactobacillus murinus]TFU66535.1 phage regulatory protein [Ligilactobacillus murinus]
MNELVVMKNQQAVTTSLVVAEAFKKNHKDVMRAISNKLGSAQNCAQYKNMFTPSFYQDASGKQNKMYYMNRDGFTFIAMGFTGRKADEFKLKYIQAFNKMEEYIKQQEQLPTSPTEMLRLAIESNLETADKVEALNTRMDEFEQNAPIDPGEYNYLSKRISSEVQNYVVSHHMILNQKQRSQLYKDVNRGVKEVTGVKTRSQLRKKDFAVVDRYLMNWTPSAATLMIIEQLDDEAKGQERLF